MMNENKHSSTMFGQQNMDDMVLNESDILLFAGRPTQETIFSFWIVSISIIPIV
jgi:hypothetical protein